MKIRFLPSALALAAVLLAPGAFAQDATTRADVKAGANAKNVPPAGETPTPMPSTRSETTRAERKAATRTDNAARKLAPAGEAGLVKDDSATKSTGPQTTRAERKAKTRAANKAGEIPSAGETGTKDLTKRP
jgi:predicted outer membrane protein